MFDWDKFHTLAVNLLTSSGEEYKRSAISRAYYGVYGKARRNLEEYCKAKGIPVPTAKDSVHAATWNGYSSLYGKNNTTAIAISIKSDRLREARVKADYGKPINNIESAASKAIKDADEIRALIDILSKSNNK